MNHMEALSLSRDKLMEAQKVIEDNTKPLDFGDQSKEDIVMVFGLMGAIAGIMDKIREEQPEPEKPEVSEEDDIANFLKDAEELIKKKA